MRKKKIGTGVLAALALTGLLLAGAEAPGHSLGVQLAGNVAGMALFLACALPFVGRAKP